MVGSGPRLETDPQKTSIQIDVYPLGIRPHGIAGVIRGVGLVDHAMDAAETVDYVVIGAFIADEEQQFFTYAFEFPGLIGFERKLVAFTGVVDDSGRLGPLRTGFGPWLAAFQAIPSRLVGNRQAGLDPKTVAVDFESFASSTIQTFGVSGGIAVTMAALAILIRRA